MMADPENGNGKHVLSQPRKTRMHFGAIKALNRGALSLRESAVLGRTGDSGADKSTMIRVIAGNLMATGGEIGVDGQDVNFADPANTRAARIRAVHHDVASCDVISAAENKARFLPGKGRRKQVWRSILESLSSSTYRFRLYGGATDHEDGTSAPVTGSRSRQENGPAAENIFLGRQLMRRLAGLPAAIDFGRMWQRAAELVDGSRSDIRVRQLVRSMPDGQRQPVAATRTLLNRSRIVLPHEPTAAIGPSQVGQSPRLIDGPRGRDISVILFRTGYGMSSPFRAGSSF